MTKKLPYMLSLSLCAATLFVACGGSATNTSNTANTGNTKTGNTSATPATTTTTTSTGDKIGVAECDDFIAKYEACVNSNVPEALRATVKAQLDTMRTSWRQAAADPQSRAGLAAGCKAAHDQARTSMSAYNCSW